MKLLPPPPRPWKFLALAAVLVSAGNAGAQTRDEDGRRAREKPGIALVKPQSWSAEEQATVLEFLAFTDRTVKAVPGAGYFEFQTRKNPKYQLPASRVVKLVIYPDPITEIVTPEQRAALQAGINELEAVGKKFSTATRPLKPSLDELRAVAAKFDEGHVMENGQWIARSGFFSGKATALVELLRPQLTKAPRVRDINLDANQYYKGLLVLAKSEPAIKPFIDEMRSLYDSLSRKEQRAEIIQSLGAPDIKFSQAEFLIAQLKEMRPEEDEGAGKLIAKWVADTTRANQIAEMIKNLRKDFEAEMGDPANTKKLRALSPALTKRVQEASDAVKQFRAAEPSPTILVPMSVAMVACSDNLPLAVKHMDSKQFFLAQAALDPVAREISGIGPNSLAAIGILQKEINASVEKFCRLRDEAKLLADGDNIAEALKKYQEAHAIIPDADIAAQIEALQKIKKK